MTDVFFKLAIPHTSVSFPGLIASTLPYLRVFSITDQPDERPSVSTLTTKSKRVVLTFNLPEDVDSILPLLEGTFALVDLLATGRVTFRSDTRAKIKKVREDVEKEIKGEASKEKKEEAAEDKRAARRKAEEERIAKLSPSEQKKVILSFLQHNSACSRLLRISSANVNARSRNHRESWFARHNLGSRKSQSGK